ncbi:Fasciclin-2 [Fragariocoptes setiger]|uniref:peptidylprolyl isomerase n=1 Tax=Fragariocoptes setiger TaxID=1670756 RepID=A0ABQ7S7W9_9ACAR|nr:Fasciclin-2 [Fragariocoptes setiger]
MAVEDDIFENIDIPTNHDIRATNATVTNGGTSIEADLESEEVFLDDNEQNLERESLAMLKIWQKESLFQPPDEKCFSDFEPKYILSEAGERSDFETLKGSMEDVHNEKVFIKICRPNPTGKQVTRHCTVLYDCKLYLEDMELPVDSSFASGSPYLTKITETLTKGLACGLINMKEGEIAQIFVHYSMAYGEHGCMPRIPPLADLLYVIHLHKSWDDGELDDFLRLSVDQQSSMPREKILEMCVRQKMGAKELFKENHIQQALVRFKAVVQCLEQYFPSSITNRTSTEYALWRSLVENQLVAYNKLRMHRSATKKAKQLLRHDPENIKALYHVAKARMFLGDYDTSIKIIQYALEFEPKNPEFARLALQLDYYKRDDATKSKELLKTIPLTVRYLTHNKMMGYELITTNIPCDASLARDESTDNIALNHTRSALEQHEKFPLFKNNISFALLLLLFINLSTHNYCNASPFAGDLKSDKPKLVIYPKTNGVHHVAINYAGFVLTCRGENEHPSSFESLEWFGPNDKVMSNSVRSQPGSVVLRFPKPTVEDSGNFTCRAVYHGSDPLEATITINFYVDAKMDCLEQQALILNRTDQKFYCLVSAQPPPTIEWFKDDKLISQNTNGRYKYSQDGYMNIIGPVTEEDAGIYTVRATVMATGTSHERHISVKVNTEPVILTNGLKVTGIEGETKEMTCTADGRPPPLISWIDPHKRNLTVEGGYIVDPLRGILKIEHLRRDRDEGQFECIASNPAGVARATFSQVVGQRPVILSFENQTVDEHGSITLECRSTGYPQPIIAIRREDHDNFKPGDILFEEHRTDKDADSYVYRLKLSRLNRTHDANYFCSSQNFAGNAERIGRLKVKFRPDLESTPKRQVYLNSQLAQVTCAVRAYPEPIITWWKDGVQLTGNDYIASKGPDGSTNILSMKVNPSIVRGVFGDYECVATNEKGESKVKIRFEEARRPGPVTSARSVITTPTTAHLEIDPPIDDGGLRLINYHISMSGAMRYDLVNTPSYLRGQQPTASGNVTLPYVGPKNLYIIRDLRPSFKYNIYIRAENELGLSMDQGFPIILETPMPTAPDPPTPTSLNGGVIKRNEEIRSRYSDGYRVTWAAPQNDNGSPVTNYRLKYYEVKLQGDKWKTVENSGSKEFSHNVHRDLKFSVADMAPGKHYKIEIRSENIFGLSEPAEFIVSAPFTGPTLTDSEVVTVSAWFGEFAPPNYLVIIVLFGALIVLIVTELTCYFRYEVGLIYFLKHNCCASNSKNIMEKHS